MGFWFFGNSRKNRSKDDTQDNTIKHGPGGASHEKMTHRNPSRGVGSHRGNQSGPRRLTKLDRSIGRDGAPTQPFSAASQATTKSRNLDSPQLHKKSNTFPTPPSNPFISPLEHLSNDVYQHNPASQSSIGPDIFDVAQRPPTLNAKRSSHDAGMPRRKTSKRRAEERQREKEIRQMSSPIPIPKRTSLPANLLRQDTRKVRGGLNSRFERPISDVSLPIPESLSDSLDDNPEHQHSFKVKAFDILAPRPTVRYTENPRYRPSRSLTHSRTSEKRPVVPAEDYKSRRRIEDLADGFDSSDIRELMERDRKRKEKKRIDDQQKLERRLQRRADRQRQQESQNNAAGPSTPSRPTVPSSPRTESSRGLATNVGEVSNVQAEKPVLKDERAQLQTPVSWLGDPSKENIAPVEDVLEEPPKVPEPPKEEVLQPPNKTFLRTDSPLDVRMSQTSVVTGSPPRSPIQRPRDRSSMSQMSGLQREYTPSIPENREIRSTRRDSGHGGGPGSSWTAFFKRGTIKTNRGSTDRGRTTPSDFSNTSRESFARQGPPPAMPQRTFRRSSTPIRTQSKFREDLPDFPLSPPDSRVQSPEAVVIPSNRSSGALGATAPRDIPGRSDSAIQDDLVSVDSPKPGHIATLSQSLASVDSEASWLSGRPAKRSSSGMAQPSRRSETSLQQKEVGHGEDDDLVNDEYLKRLSPAPDSRRESGVVARRASSTIFGQPGDSDDESELQPAVPRIPGSYLNEPGTTLHGGVGRRPTLVTSQHGRAKSREGLLNQFDDSDDDFDEDSLVTSEEHPVQRHHIRHVSGGSAKLLDVRRTSLDSNKRLSSVEVASQQASIHSPELEK